MWQSHWHIEKWWARQESQKAHNYLENRLRGSQSRRGVILIPLLGLTVSPIIWIWEENIYILTGFWALPGTAKGVLWRITIPNGHKILKNGLKSVRCASAQTNSQRSNWCHPRTRCTETKKGMAEQVALPERSHLEHELMLANVAGRKVCVSEAQHVKCDWVTGHWYRFTCVQIWTPLPTKHKTSKSGRHQEEQHEI